MTLADQIHNDPCASHWLRAAVKVLEGRDPVDALHDAQALAAAMQQRLSILEGGYTHAR